MVSITSVHTFDKTWATSPRKIFHTFSHNLFSLPITMYVPMHTQAIDLNERLLEHVFLKVVSCQVRDVVVHAQMGVHAIIIKSVIVNSLH